MAENFKRQEMVTARIRQQLLSYYYSRRAESATARCAFCYL
uniref:Uncharacterized protein n=1 Tax=Salmonella sp. TaxID=599 RepID=A0A482EUN6_SALSP|nr:hypothetical protein NNIBIDOC_00218 [Salmonella sp.]